MLGDLPSLKSYQVKLFIDKVVAVVALVILFPLMLFVAFIVRTDGRQIFFKHERVGYGGKAFGCYKFRTMKCDSEEILKNHLMNNEEAAAEWKEHHKLCNDPRITKVGVFLRRSRLDELPQFINLLKGEMSLVGPRPVTQYELERYYKQYAKCYLSVVPGIFGPWQLQGRNLVSYFERVQIDVGYISNWSLWNDFKILFASIPVILRFSGR